MSEKLHRDVDEITSMPYVKYLWWSNFFKLQAEEEYLRTKNR